MDSRLAACVTTADRQVEHRSSGLSKSDIRYAFHVPIVRDRPSRSRSLFRRSRVTIVSYVRGDGGRDNASLRWRDSQIDYSTVNYTLVLIMYGGHGGYVGIGESTY